MKSVNVYMGWQTATDSGVHFGPVFNSNLDLWAWQKANLTHKEAASGFCAALEWADVREGTRARLSPRSRGQIAIRVFRFIEANRAAYADAMRTITPDKFGFMLFLSMAGHGTGFFDEGALPETLRDSLQDACHAYRIETEQYGGWIGIYADNFGSLADVRIYDNGGKTADRYTAVYMSEPERPGHFACLGMNCEPFHPQGIGMHASAMPGRHLGRRVDFYSLPLNCQKAIARDLTPV